MSRLSKIIKSQIPALILLLTAAYICLGALILRRIESPESEPPESWYHWISMNISDDSIIHQYHDTVKSNLTNLTYVLTRRDVGQEQDDTWSFGSAVLFTFSVVTTIGYGHIAPVTVGGRIFTMIYALIGIPLGILGIANIGQYVTEALLYLYRMLHILQHQASKKLKKRNKPNHSGTTSADTNCYLPNGSVNSHAQKSKQLSDPVPDNLPSWLLIVLFLGWMLIGSAVLPKWEQNLGTWDAFWFSFVSLTTIGFGDIYPTNYSHFPFTYIYLMTGLVFTTMAIDVLADYLRQIHNYGRSLTNLGSTKIWFGGSTITTDQLFSGVMHQLPINQDTIDMAMGKLDSLIETAIKNKNIVPNRVEHQQLPEPSMQKESTEEPLLVEEELHHSILKAFPGSDDIDFIDD